MFTFVLCGFCEALAGEMSVFLTFLALEPGCRTVESWSVSCVSTAFTCLDQRALEILVCAVFVLVYVAALVEGLA